MPDSDPSPQPGRGASDAGGGGAADQRGAPAGGVVGVAAGSGPAGSGASGGGYRVVARRYRPQRFVELVGQEHVARGLAGAILSGRVGHAYLFTGGRGVGKTSAARILAKALQCERGPAAEPCDACDACLAIAAGQDIDVVEIDAASNRGIDEIRQLRQNVAVRPARGRYKVYIIDEVHMLTREAFNALLKTLEEPPGHVKFVLCTTEPDKLPVTILSRCQRFDFHVVDAAAIAGRLTQIAAAEGVAITPEAIGLIARRANGSMRDSQSLLEQLLGGAGQLLGGAGQLLGGAAPAAGHAIGVDDVHAVIGTGREELLGAIVAAIVARDPRGAIVGLDAARAGGADPGGVIEQLLAALRDCLVASVGCGREALREGPGLGIDALELGPRLGTATVLAMLQIVDQTLNRMRTSGHAVVLAEMAVIRLATLEDLDGLAELVDQVVQGGGLPAAAAPRGPAPAAPLSAAVPRAPDEREKKTEQPAAVTAGPADDPRCDTGGGATGARPAAPAGEQSIAPLPEGTDPLEVWRACGAVVGGLVADFAQLAVRAVWHEGRLDVALPAESAAAATFLRGADVSAGLQRALAALVGRPAKVVFEVDAPAAVPATVAPGGALSASDRGPAAPQRTAQSQSALIRESAAHPLVERARELFDAAIRKVEPPRPRAEPAAVSAVHAGAVTAGSRDTVSGDSVFLDAAESAAEPGTADEEPVDG